MGFSFSSLNPISIADKLTGGIAGDILGGITGKPGAAAAGQAGTLQSEAIREAAGLEAGAIGQAAELSADANAQALQLLQEQLGITRGQFQPFLQAGVGALPELQQGFQAPEGTTAGGLESIINQIMGGEAFGGLVDERTRAVQGQLAAGGLTRSGQAVEEAAAIPTDLAFQLENMLFGRQSSAEQQRIQGLQGLVSGGQQAAAQEGGQAGNLTQAIMQAIQGGAAQQAGAITGAAGATGRGIRESAGATASGILGGAQAKAQGIQNLLNIGGSLATAFSDPRLKENIKTIGKIGPLDLIEWEWKPELEDSFVKDFPTMGFMSTQVKEIWPEHVSSFGGYDVVNYPGVMREVEKWH